MIHGAANLRAATAALLAGLACAAAISLYAGESVIRSGTALLVIYAFGYVTGALLVEPKHDRETLSLAILRLVSGLLLTTIGFFLCLVTSLPWFIGPIALLMLAVILHGRVAFAPPRTKLTFSWGGAVAGLVGVVLLGPSVISLLRMAPGDFPPMFFNVDTAYFLEKVHALVKTHTYPPESLGVLGGRRAYHFGIHGLAALISRSSGLAPHHALFLLVLPLLSLGVFGAAWVLARRISSTLPSVVAVPMLLISIPTLWYHFTAFVGERLWLAVSSRTFAPLTEVFQNYEELGVATNNGQNLAGHFIVLASLAGIIAAASQGWRLPVFLIGSAVLFKTTTGVSLVAGFSLAQAFQAARARSLRPLIPAAAAVAVFGAVQGAFWRLPRVPAEFRMELYPLFHLRGLGGPKALLGFVLDVLLLLLPALVVLPARLKDTEKRSVPWLVFAVTPLVLVNALRLVDLRPSVAGGVHDWIQVLLPVPLVLHAFVLSVVGSRWGRLPRTYRQAFLSVVGLMVVPLLFVAARYSLILITDPERGHEFADNRSLGAALAVIPTHDTIIVTNDLRYPADGFRRNDRQMQIPALFGHQAFAVNYEYEGYPFSPARHELQQLLSASEWSEDIERAANTYHWTHLLIRKDYIHPATIPLEQIFANEFYSVFRFGPATPSEP